MKFSKNGLKDYEGSRRCPKQETYLYNGKKEETVFQTKLDLFRGDENSKDLRLLFGIKYWNV